MTDMDRLLTLDNTYFMEESINGYIGDGKKVHRFVQAPSPNRYLIALCLGGSWNNGFSLNWLMEQCKITPEEVTCKTCLQILNKKGEK